MSVDILEIGKSGLFSSKKSMQTTGHNIANVNTDGFSRQRTVQATNPPVGSGKFIFGTGSNIKLVERIQNSHVEKKLIGATSEHSYNTARNDLLINLEGIFNEITNEGLNQILNKFFNSFRELSAQPESETTRSIVRENSKILIRDLQRNRISLNESVRDIDRIYETSVYDINSLLHNIANLNTKINAIEVGSGESGDLRDQRDVAVKSLSEFFALDTYTDNKGNFIVNAKGIGTLASGQTVQELVVGSSPNDEVLQGSKDIYLGKHSSTPIGSKFSQGKLEALYETKTTEIKIMQSKIDDLAWHVTNAVNAIHKRGFKNSLPSDSTNQINHPNESPMTNIDFFKPLVQRFGAAENIDLSEDVKDDLKNIVSAFEPNSPGDNRIALAISKLQYERLAGQGSKTLEEDYLEGVGVLGLTTGKSKINAEQSDSILAQIRNVRERISGVSIDEEASNLMRYQQAFEASARVIRTAEEIFKTVLQMKN